MAILHLLPLGTVVKPKESVPGWEDLRYMVTSYFPVSRDGGKCYDYAVTPWPLGFVNEKGGKKRFYYCCNEDAIEKVEFLGCIDGDFRRESERYYEEALRRDDLDSYLAVGNEPLMFSFSDIQDNVKDFPVGDGGFLPLGSVVSVTDNADRKVMIYQHSGFYGTACRHYDYGICAWPEGEPPEHEKIYVINRDEITAVHFRGYENALSQELAKRLEKKRRGSLFTRLFGR